MLWLVGLLTVLGTMAAATPASASGWGWGTSFRVGGIRLQIGHPPHYAGHVDHYYYRVDVPLRSRARCTDRCFVRRSSTYHHRHCPVIRGHLGYHGHDAAWVFDRYAPAFRHRAPYRYRGDRPYGRYSPRDRIYWERQRSRDLRRHRRWERERRERWRRERREERRRRPYRWDD